MNAAGDGVLNSNRHPLLNLRSGLSFSDLFLSSKVTNHDPTNGRFILVTRFSTAKLQNILQH